MITSLISGANMLPEKPAATQSSSQPSDPSTDPMATEQTFLQLLVAQLRTRIRNSPRTAASLWPSWRNSAHSNNRFRCGRI